MRINRLKAKPDGEAVIVTMEVLVDTGNAGDATAIVLEAFDMRGAHRTEAYEQGFADGQEDEQALIAAWLEADGTSWSARKVRDGEHRKVSVVEVTE